jgi:tetratricopeptide (TPR) repeat protein
MASNFGVWEKAIADFTKIIELNPDYANAYYNRGMAYKNLQDYQSAIADLKEAERLFCSSESPNCQKVQEILRQLQNMTN